MVSDIAILIAEDEAQLRGFMAEYLQLIFEKVYTAEDGMEAFRTYERHRPDIIIADIHMPKMDGLTLIRKIREHDRRTKIIVLSAHSEKEKLLQAIELHLVKYLIKPVQSEVLKTMLLSLVGELRQAHDRVALKAGYYWERGNKRLLQEGHEITLKPKERKALELLCSRPGQTVSAYDLYNALYEDEPEREFSYHAVTSAIKRLRTKLPEGTIVNVYGSGYRLQTA